MRRVSKNRAYLRPSEHLLRNPLSLVAVLLVVICGSGAAALKAKAAVFDNPTPQLTQGALPNSSRGSLNSKQVPALLRGVGIDQKLNQQIPLNVPFRDETGKEVFLSDYFGKKPVVLSLVYFSCPMLCTTVENNLLQ